MRLFDTISDDEDVWGELRKRVFREDLKWREKPKTSKEEYKLLCISLKDPFLFIRNFRRQLPEERLSEFVCSYRWRACLLLNELPIDEKEIKNGNKREIAYAKYKRNKRLRKWLSSASKLNNGSMVKDIIKKHPEIECNAIQSKLYENNIETIKDIIGSLTVDGGLHCIVHERERDYFSAKAVRNIKDLYRETPEYLYAGNLNERLHNKDIDHRSNLLVEIDGLWRPDKHQQIVERITIFDDVDLLDFLWKKPNNEALDGEKVLQRAAGFGSLKVIKDLADTKKIKPDNDSLACAIKEKRYAVINYFLNDCRLKLNQDNFNDAAEYCEFEAFKEWKEQYLMAGVASNLETLQSSVRGRNIQTTKLIVGEGIRPDAEIHSDSAFGAFEVFLFIDKEARENERARDKDICANAFWFGDFKTLKHLVEDGRFSEEDFKSLVEGEEGFEDKHVGKLMFLIDCIVLSNKDYDKKSLIETLSEADRCGFCCLKYLVEKCGWELKDTRKYDELSQRYEDHKPVKTVQQEETSNSAGLGI